MAGASPKSREDMRHLTFVKQPGTQGLLNGPYWATERKFIHHDPQQASDATARAFSTGFSARPTGRFPVQYER